MYILYCVFQAKGFKLQRLAWQQHYRKGREVYKINRFLPFGCLFVRYIDV